VRIGMVIGLHGSTATAPRWRQLLDQVQTAEQVGFDLAVIEDALLSPSDEQPIGFWESASMAGAMLAATSVIEVGHSVVNAPYRSPTLVAKMADTLDEIGDGRYVFGVGAGNTPDDYEPFGFPADRRVARFAEWIEIVSALLQGGSVEFAGEHHFAHGAELVPRGPSPGGPPIVIAAKGPRMMRLTARFADGWNWWTSGRPDLEALRSIVRDIVQACEAAERDPSTLRRSLDVYSIDPIGARVDAPDAISGGPEAIADVLLGFGEIGFEEVRCNLLVADAPGRLPGAIEAMGDVVALVHAGSPVPRRTGDPTPDLHHALR
jgi:alkanesulfonate monooxygenase SsuD/methylene tetrahydromethanopterin reductase-like flavin-dependent oxidoreductase (luciferase family)